MKNRIWIALLLAATLALPALAQQQTQSSNPDQNQPAAQQQSQPAQGQQSQPDQTQQQNPQQQQQPAAQPDQSQQNTQQPAAQQSGQTAGAHEPLKVEEKQGFWGKLNPFARKKYVQKQMTPIRDRVNELDELTAGNSKMIKDVDSRATEGIRMASSKADAADQHAVQAGQSAQQANQTAQEATNRLQTMQQVVSNVDQYKPVTETEIRFRPGQALLSKKAKDALDEMATPLANQRGYIIEVQGYSPGKGQAAVQDSQSLAQSVVRYLVLQHNVPVYRIYVMGMGNAPMQASSEQAGASKRNVRGRRVEVALLKNDLEQIQAQPSSTGGTTGEGGMSGTTAQPASGAQPAQPATPPASSQPTKPQTPPPSSQQQTPPPMR